MYAICISYHSAPSLTLKVQNFTTLPLVARTLYFCPEVLLNVPAEKLPAEYVKVTYKADLTKIRKLLKADAQGAIGWASLSEPH